VPAFASAATIFVSEPLLAADDVAARRAGSAAVVRRLAARLAGQPPAVTDSVLRPGEVLVFDGASLSFRAMSTGQPVRSDHLGQETVDRLTRRPGGHQIAAGYTTFLAVPLAARGLVLGCATFARAPRDPGFEPDDIALAAGLAARAAVCIDNARLYDRERRTAFALQHGLLPREPCIPAGMEVAHRYFPVGASVVGGDWHDIVRLPGGRAALIVGDAMGHGPEAAAVMVQLRTAAHTLASLDLPLEDILHRLDRMAAGMPAAPFATCICTVIDPERNSCVIAKAGHPPPLLARPGRAPQVLDLPQGLPLGLGAGSFEATEVSLPPGTTLAPVHRRPGGKPHPSAGRGHRHAGRHPGLGAGPARRAARHRMRVGHPGAAPARRGRRHAGARPDPARGIRLPLARPSQPGPASPAQPARLSQPAQSSGAPTRSRISCTAH
jgi:Stage II sporulation protein E (SpoIIE)/GAF domain